MQRQSESLFIALKTREHQVIRLRGERPRAVVRPARPGLAVRGLLRLVPRLARHWHLRALRGCGLFEAGWYLAQNPDVQDSGADPALHYLLHGAAEGRDPGPGFSTAHYLKLYPDVQAAGMNPLIHYLIAGWDENRSIHPGMPETRV